MGLEDSPLRRLQCPPPISLLFLLPHLHSDMSLARTASPRGESWLVMLPGVDYFGHPYSKAAETLGF